EDVLDLHRRSASFEFDEPEVTVFAAIKHGQLLRGRVGEDEEVVARPSERLDRLVEGHRLGRHATRDHAGTRRLARRRRTLFAGQGPGTGGPLVLLPFGAKLLGLVLELA